VIQNRVSTKFITGIVTFVNGRIWEPQLLEGYDIPLYTMTILIPKAQVKTNKAMQKALETAIINGQSLHRGKFAKSARLNTPIHDGDAEGAHDCFRGCWIVNAANTIAPAIWDNSLMPITDRDLVQPGCKVRVSLTLFAYIKDDKHKTGVGCVLGNIQKVFTRNDYKILPDIDYEQFVEEFTRVFSK